MKAKISIFIVFFLAAGLLMGCGDRNPFLALLETAE
jgi:hypothetical protein